MAEPRDDRVSRAYREMPGDGPSPALDAAIQAAARRAAGSRPGAIRRLQLPLSIAAVLALAIGVSLQVEREKPMGVDGAPVPSGSAEYPVPQAASEAEVREAPAKGAPTPAAPAPVAPSESAPVSKERQRTGDRLPAQPARANDAAPVPEAKRFVQDPPHREAPRPATPLPEPPAPAAPARAPALPAAAPAVPPPAAAGSVRPVEAERAVIQAAPRAKSEAARESIAPGKAMADSIETPEQRLQRIADLRARGLHEEADRALAEFRRSFPAHRITDEWLLKVERR